MLAFEDPQIVIRISAVDKEARFEI